MYYIIYIFISLQIAHLYGYYTELKKKEYHVLSMEKLNICILGVK